MSGEEFAAFVVGFGFRVVILDGIEELHSRMERRKR